MGRIPGRVAAAFDADVAFMRLCESSGSEHSLPEESSTDLSALVKSFMEKCEMRAREGEEEDKQQEDQVTEKSDQCFDSELEGLFGGGEDEDHEIRNAKEKIRGEVGVACAHVGDISMPQFKRRLMSNLRDRGFDAGLCKSNWEKNARLTAGDYEYIDVNFSGNRFIVEVSLAAEFEIARPTSQYSSLLDAFPMVFVGKVEELKRVVRLMCNAIKGSMKRSDLHIPPWRRNGYMQAKWFSSYKRTTNAVATRKAIASSTLYPESLSPRRSIGFEPWPVIQANSCRERCVSNTGFRIGHLTATFNSDDYGVQ